MPRPPSMATVWQSFQTTIDSSENLYGAVGQFCLRTYEGITQNPLHPTQARRIVSLAFLGTVAAWEQYLEAVFVRYLAGARSHTGYHPHLRAGTAQNLQHAYDLLSGKFEFKTDSQYLTWSSPSDVIRRAKIFFTNGHPFNAALTHWQDRLRDAIRIRNRIAHTSGKSRAEFKQVALAHLGRAPNARLSQGYSAGDLLLETAARGLDPKFRQGTFFEAYMEMFRDLAQRLTPV